MTEEKPQVLLTKEGYENLKKELKHREGELRKKLQDTLNQMRSQGDLSENDGYTIAVTDHDDSAVLVDNLGALIAIKGNEIRISTTGFCLLDSFILKCFSK